jgi:predicted  nucleic acid-binding Zn-ribbon protein
MGSNAEERERFRAELEDLKKRAAETDKRIEEREEENARLIERLQQLRRRLDRYC